MKVIMQEYLLTKWAQAGFTVDTLKEAIKDFDMTALEKSANFTSLPAEVYNFATKTAPLYAIGIPAAASFLAYGITHPDLVDKMLRNTQRKAIKKRIKRYEPAPYNSNTEEEEDE